MKCFQLGQKIAFVGVVVCFLYILCILTEGLFGLTVYVFGTENVESAPASQAVESEAKRVEPTASVPVESAKNAKLLEQEIESGLEVDKEKEVETTKEEEDSAKVKKEEEEEDSTNDVVYFVFILLFLLWMSGAFD